MITLYFKISKNLSQIIRNKTKRNKLPLRHQTTMNWQEKVWDYSFVI